MPSERIQRRIDHLLDQAEEAAESLDWVRVRELAQRVLVADPGNPDATTLVAMVASEPAARAVGAADTEDPANPAGSGLPGKGEIRSRPGLIVDYEQTMGILRLLTDVRFKLAAFIPALTAASVVVTTERDLAPASQFAVSLGGLVITLGLVLYNARNDQHYNSASGRAQALEEALGLDAFGGDVRPGVIGSRHDSTRRLRSQGRDRVLWLPVRHSPALALVYGAALGVWVWLALEALFRALSDWAVTYGLDRLPTMSVEASATLGTMVATALAIREFIRLGRTPPTASEPTGSSRSNDRPST